MGLNDEYSRDAYAFEDAHDTDSESSDFDPYLDEEDWQAMYSEELGQAWGLLQEYAWDNFLTLSCNYTMFVEFVLESDRWPPSDAFFHAERAWNKINDIPVVYERVQPGNFYTWFSRYI